MAIPEPDPLQLPDDGAEGEGQPGLESLTAAAEATRAIAKPDEPEA